MKKSVFLLLGLLRVGFCVVCEPPIPLASHVHQANLTLENLGSIHARTGEFLDSHCDIEVAGCLPLRATRFYHHTAAPHSLYGCWSFNPETMVLANFENQNFPRGVIVGDEKGNFLSLAEVGKRTFRFNACDQPDYLGENRNCKLVYQKNIDVKDTKRFLYKGQISDGEGRIRKFQSVMHQWNSKVKNKKGSFLPHLWTPFNCLVREMTLPNGNVIAYQYTRFFDDKNHPTHYRLSKIIAHNKKRNKMLGYINFAYPNEFDNATQIVVRGSDRRVVRFKLRAKQPQASVAGHEIFTLTEVITAHDQSTSYEYDSQLRVCKKTLPTGESLELDYDAQNRVECVRCVDSEGSMRRIELHYGGDHTEIVDEGGERQIFRFDAKGRNIATELYESHRLVRAEKTLYNSAGLAIEKSVENGDGKLVKKLSYRYDARGEVLEKTLHGDLRGKGSWDSYTMSYTYSDGPHVCKLSAADGQGLVTHFTYLPNTNLVRSELVYHQNKIVRRAFYAYDDAAILVRKIVDDGKSQDPTDISSLTYRRVTEITPIRKLPCYGLPECVEEKTIDSFGSEVLLSRVLYTYHPTGKISREEYYDGAENYMYAICYDYDKRGKLLSKINMETRRSERKFDADGNQVAFLGAPQTRRGRCSSTIFPDGSQEKREHNALGHVCKIVDPNGLETLKEYNLRGQPIHIVHPDQSEERFEYDLKGNLTLHRDRGGVETLYKYDLFDHVIEKTTCSSDHSLSRTEHFQYSPFCLLSSTDAEGVRTTYSYDHAGRKIAEECEGQEKLFAYDAFGKLIREQKGSAIHVHKYDAFGRLSTKRIEDLEGNLCSYESYQYDDRDNCVLIETSLGVTTQTFDEKDRLILSIDPLGYETQITYSDGPFASKTVIDPQGRKDVFSYDHRGRIVEKRRLSTRNLLLHKQERRYDLSGHITECIEHVFEEGRAARVLHRSWEYGPMGEILHLNDGNQTYSYGYDQGGNLTRVSKPGGIELNMVYDGLGRMVHLTSNKNDIDYRYAYDLCDRLLTIYDGVHKQSVQRIYDVHGNLLEEKLANGLQIKNAYSLEGERSTLILPDDSVIFYSYNGGKLGRVTRGELCNSYLERNEAGLPNKIELPGDGGLMLISWNPKLQWRDKNSLQHRVHFSQDSFDGAGNLCHYRIMDAIGGMTINYRFDECNQLASENGFAYTYDSLGTRTQKNGYRYKISPALEVLDDGTTHYAYDARGNRITSSSLQGPTSYEYDSLDRLISIKQGRFQIHYAYDALNRRMQKTVGQQTTLFLWDGEREIGAYTTAFKPLQLRVLGEGLGTNIYAPVLIEIGQNTYIPSHDYSGSLASLGAIETPFSTTPYHFSFFGERETPDSTCPWQYRGGRLDPETNLIYLEGRYYDPKLGSFLTPDPHRFTTNFHPYSLSK